LNFEMVQEWNKFKFVYLFIPSKTLYFRIVSEKKKKKKNQLTKPLDGITVFSYFYMNSWLKDYF
jgi:hypothetical protein